MLNLFRFKLPYHLRFQQLQQQYDENPLLSSFFVPYCSIMQLKVYTTVYDGFHQELGEDSKLR